MTARPTDNSDQRAFWSVEAGGKWVAQQDAMDALMAPVLDLVMAQAMLQPGEAVLDVGCGAGTSTVAAARHVAPGGTVMGIDISDTLLDQARERFGQVDGVKFLHADAETHRFPAATYDALISRFGVMFFANTVAAFQNMTTVMRPGGRLVMAAWGPAPNNPWFMLPAQVAATHLGKMPKTDRSLPGPFAFEDKDRIVAELEKAGLTDLNAVSHALLLTPDGGPMEAAELCCHIGPAESAIRHFNATADDTARIRDDIAKAFAAFGNDPLRISADINLFTARIGH